MNPTDAPEDIRFLKDVQSWPLDGRPLSLARHREHGRRLEDRGLLKLGYKRTSTRFPMLVARLTAAGLAALSA